MTYTPKTAEIREYVEVGGEPRPWEEQDDAKDAARAEAFDRWLAAHDAQVREAELLAAVADMRRMPPEDQELTTPIEFLTARAAAIRANTGEQKEG